MVNALGSLATALLALLRAILGVSPSERIITQSGADYIVTVELRPPLGTLAYALEEKPPLGWAISINTSGAIMSPPVIKYGVFFDGNHRTLSYIARPGGNAPPVFSGVISFDGVSRSIQGRLTPP